jgi:hypothetical protein
MLQKNTIALKLQEARDLIAEEKNWCKNVFSTNENGIPQFCARGAVMHVLGAEQPSWAFAENSVDYQTIDSLLTSYSIKIFLPPIGTSKYYDNHHTRANFCIADVNNNGFGHDAVMKCFDAAIKEAQETF